MNIGEYAIEKKTVTLVLTVMAVVAGFMAYGEMGRLEDPEFTIKEAVIMTRYPGASAAEVEEEVTNVLEKAVQEMIALRGQAERRALQRISAVMAELPAEKREAFVSFLKDRACMESGR